MKKNAWWTLGRNVVSVLLAALLAVPAGLAGEVSAVVPADLEGVILESVPAEWGDLVSPVPTEVPGLYVVVAQPYLAMDPRANEFRARWDGREVDPTDPQAVAEMLADPALEGATVLVFSLWRQVDEQVQFLGYVTVEVVDGSMAASMPTEVTPASFDESIARWRVALMHRIRANRDLRDPRLAVEISWYTVFSGDEWVQTFWLTRLMGPGEDCGRSVGNRDDCKDCCEDEYWEDYMACDMATGLAGAGACSISAVCGAAWTLCCAFFGGWAASSVNRLCTRAVDKKVNACTSTCKKLVPKKP